MQYTNLLNRNLEIYPIFWEWNIKNPVFLSMDDTSEWLNSLSNEQICNQDIYNSLIMKYAEENNSDLLISWFLEKREIMFRALWFIQMVNQERFYHLGLDLSLPMWQAIYAPLDWEVYDSWYEQWDWNYWGYVILKHNVDWYVFYSFYWHQNRESIPEIWVTLNRWELISRLWDYSDNGWYFHHLHLQVITQEGIDNWFASKWYIREDELKDISRYVLDPNYVFRY